MDAEAVQDVVGAMVTGDLSITYSDTAGTLTINNNIEDIEDLDNVNVSSASGTQILQYNAADSEWQNEFLSIGTGDIDTGTSTPSDGEALVYDAGADALVWRAVSGGSGTLTISGATDTTITTPISDGIPLSFNSSDSKWKNKAVKAVGIDTGAVTAAKLNADVKEQVEDWMDDILSEGTGITITHDDDGNDIEIKFSGALNDLSDVTNATPAVSDVLIYKDATTGYENRQLSSGDLPNNIINNSLLADDSVDLTKLDVSGSPSSGQVLEYDGSGLGWTDKAQASYATTLPGTATNTAVSPAVITSFMRSMNQSWVGRRNEDVNLNLDTTTNNRISDTATNKRMSFIGGAYAFDDVWNEHGVSNGSGNANAGNHTTAVMRAENGATYHCRYNLLGTFHVGAATTGDSSISNTGVFSVGRTLPVVVEFGMQFAHKAPTSTTWSAWLDCGTNDITNIYDASKFGSLKKTMQVDTTSPRLLSVARYKTSITNSLTTGRVFADVAIPIEKCITIGTDGMFLMTNRDYRFRWIIGCSEVGFSGADDSTKYFSSISTVYNYEERLQAQRYV